MKKIFISYRRKDSAVFTGRLYDRLIDYYGQDTIFLDIDSIPGSLDFREVVHSYILKCSLFIAVIGRQWEGESEAGRRIDDPADHVRIEIEDAITKKKPIIPVYCDDRDKLESGSLPVSLHALAYANAITIDPTLDFNHHVLRLRREMNKILFPSYRKLILHIAARFAKRNRIAIGLLMVFAISVYLLRAPVGRSLLPREGLHTAVNEIDADSFHSGEGGCYQIARGLPDRKSLIGETDLPKTIRETRESFDVFALTASVFFNNGEALTTALERNAKFRFLILDHSELNRANVEAYFSHSAVKGSGFEWSGNNSKLAALEFVRLGKEAKSIGKGSVEVRFWRGIFLNSFWIRDGRVPSRALAHAELTFYGDAAYNPSVRFGSLCPKMTVAFQDQFDYMWNHPMAVEVADKP